MMHVPTIIFIVLCFAALAKSNTAPTISGDTWIGPSTTVPSGTVLTSINATDPDSGADGQITMSIISGDTSLFSIDSSSGDIKTTGTMSNGTTYILVVMAADGGNTSLNANHTIRISATDLTVSAISWDFTINSGSTVDQIVDKMQTVLRTSNANAMVYVAESSSCSGCSGSVTRISITATTDSTAASPVVADKNFLQGQLTMAGSTMITALANSGISSLATFVGVGPYTVVGSPVNYYTTDITTTEVTTVITTPTNNAPKITGPAWAGPGYTIPAGTLILTVNATDTDSGNEGVITLSITSDHNSIFAVSASGQVTKKTSSNLAQTIYTVVITAKDGGANQKSATHTVKIAGVNLATYALTFDYIAKNGASVNDVLAKVQTALKTVYANGAVFAAESSSCSGCGDNPVTRISVTAVTDSTPASPPLVTLEQLKSILTNGGNGLSDKLVAAGFANSATFKGVGEYSAIGHALKTFASVTVSTGGSVGLAHFSQLLLTSALTSLLAWKIYF